MIKTLRKMKQKKKMKSILFPVMLFLMAFITSCNACNNKEFKDLSFNEKYDSLIRLKTNGCLYINELENKGISDDSISKSEYLSEFNEKIDKLNKDLSTDTTLNKVILSYLKKKSKCPSTVVVDSIYTHIIVDSKHITANDTFVVFKDRNQYDTLSLSSWNNLQFLYGHVKKIEKYKVPHMIAFKEHMSVTVFWTANNAFNAPIASENTILMNRLQIDCSDMDFSKNDRINFFSKYNASAMCTIYYFLGVISA